MTGVSSPAEANDFSSRLCVQTSSEAHPASCPVGAGILSREKSAANHKYKIPWNYEILYVDRFSEDKLILVTQFL
jgi:hypothetical protein